MNMLKSVGRALGYMLLLGLFVGGTTVLAQDSQNPGSGLQITPTRHEVTIEPGAASTITIGLKNVSGGEVVAQAIVNDFEPDDDTGAPRINPDVNAEGPTSIKPFLQGLEDVPLADDETKEVTLTLSLPEGVSPGAYYGVIRYQAVPVEAGGEPGQVSLTASVGSIVLLEVPGNITKSMRLDALRVERDGAAKSLFFLDAPDQAVLSVTNTGNSYIKPFGKISISKSGDEVYSYELNNVEPRGNVLPDSLRNFRHSEDEFKKKVSGFGRYTMVANIGFDEGSEVLTITASFWVIPLWFVITVLVVLVLIAAAVFYLRRKSRAGHPRRVRR